MKTSIALLATKVAGGLALIATPALLMFNVAQNTGPASNTYLLQALTGVCFIVGLWLVWKNADRLQDELRTYDEAKKLKKAFLSASYPFVGSSDANH